MTMPNVLVVGSGLYGSFFANYLASHDIEVTVFETFEEPGGLAFDQPKSTGTKKCHVGAYGLTTLTQPSPIIRKYIRHKTSAKLIPVWQRLGMILGNKEDCILANFAPIYNKLWDDRTIQLLKRTCESRFKWLKKSISEEALSQFQLQFSLDRFILKDGWSSLIDELLDHENITLNLNTTYILEDSKNFTATLYTGRLDELFNPKLPYIWLGSVLQTFDKHEPIITAGYYYYSVIQLDDDNTDVIFQTHYSPMWDVECSEFQIMSHWCIPPENGKLPYRPVITTESKLQHNKLAKQVRDLGIMLGGPTATWSRMSAAETIEGALKHADAFIERLF